MREAIVVPDRGPRQAIQFFEHCEASRKAHLVFRLSQMRRRFQGRAQQRLEHVPHSRHPRRNAVDAGIEVVEADVDSVQLAAANRLSGNYPAVIRLSYRGFPGGIGRRCVAVVQVAPFQRLGAGKAAVCDAYLQALAPGLFPGAG